MSDNEELIEKLDNWFNWALANGSNPIWKDKTPGESALNAISPILAAHDAQVREEGAKQMQEAAAEVLSRSIHDLNEALIDAEPLTADEDADAAQALGMLGRIEGSIRALPIPSTGAENTDSDEKDGQR